MKKNKAAQALGRLAAGKAKHYSQEEIDARTARLAAARAKRWAGHTPKKRGSKKEQKKRLPATGQA